MSSGEVLYVACMATLTTKVTEYTSNVKRGETGKNIRKKKKSAITFDVTTTHGDIRGRRMSCARNKLENTSNLETLGSETDINGEKRPSRPG